MRINPKYFVPFLLIVAVVTISIIALFNLRSMGNQQLKFKQSVENTDEIFNHEFPFILHDGRLVLDELEHDILMLFFSSWSSRSEPAVKRILEIRDELDNPPEIVLVAIKDDFLYLEPLTENWTGPYHLVDGTELYNKLRVPGLPALVYFRGDKKVAGSRLGFRNPDDFDFVFQALEKDGRNE